MKNNISFRSMALELMKGEKIVIFPHKAPDGDALGAAIGLSAALRQLGKTTWVLIDEAIKEELTFLDKNNVHVSLDTSIVDKDSFVVMVDCGEIARIPGREEAFQRGKKSFCIDHHGTSIPFCDHNIIVPEKAATCELIWDLILVFEQLYELAITQDIMKPIYTGILTDTGGFRYSNTTADTHEIAADMISRGLKHYVISQAIFESAPISKTILKGCAINNMKLFSKDQGAITFLTQKTVNELGADIKDTDGIVEELRNIKTVEVACFCKEEKDGSVKVSMRSKSKVDASEIAINLGGGGHMKAAGLILEMPIGEAVKFMEKEIRKYIE